MSTQKFRPVLTHSQLLYILDLTSHNPDKRDAGKDSEIQKVIIPMLAKISVGAITPAYSISPEAEQKRIESDLRKRYENDEMSPEEQADYESKILGFS
jgi:hypothetical protein